VVLGKLPYEPFGHTKYSFGHGTWPNPMVRSLAPTATVPVSMKSQGCILAKTVFTIKADIVSGVWDLQNVHGKQAFSYEPRCSSPLHFACFTVVSSCFIWNRNHYSPSPINYAILHINPMTIYAEVKQ
jgi:hypothetical protein